MIFVADLVCSVKTKGKTWIEISWDVGNPDLLYTYTLNVKKQEELKPVTVTVQFKNSWNQTGLMVSLSNICSQIRS